MASRCELFSEELRAAGAVLRCRGAIRPSRGSAARDRSGRGRGPCAGASHDPQAAAAADVLPLFKSVVELQRSVSIVRAFAPLPRTTNPSVPTTGYDDVKRVALARLVVDNVPSIQVDWSLYGPKLAQVALTVGADDVDGVSPEGETTEGRRRAPLEEIRRNIRAAGQEPVERDGALRFRPPRALSPEPREPSLRLGAVGYLNARPLVFGLERSPRFELRFDIPSECARSAARAIDRRRA